MAPPKNPQVGLSVAGERTVGEWLYQLEFRVTSTSRERIADARIRLLAELGSRTFLSAVATADGTRGVQLTSVSLACLGSSLDLFFFSAQVARGGACAAG